jgi:hypothetical protein
MTVGELLKMRQFRQPLGARGELVIFGALSGG